MTVEEIGDANQTVARGQLPRLAAKGEGSGSSRSPDPGDTLRWILFPALETPLTSEPPDVLSKLPSHGDRTLTVPAKAALERGTASEVVAT
jgi:hypothetical protein